MPLRSCKDQQRTVIEIQPRGSGLSLLPYQKPPAGPQTDRCHRCANARFIVSMPTHVFTAVAVAVEQRKIESAIQQLFDFIANSPQTIRPARCQVRQTGITVVQPGITTPGHPPRYRNRATIHVDLFPGPDHRGSKTGLQRICVCSRQIAGQVGQQVLRCGQQCTFGARAAKLIAGNKLRYTGELSIHQLPLTLIINRSDIK